MFLWNLKAAADALRFGRLDQWDGGKYLVAASLIQAGQTGLAGFLFGTKLDIFGLAGYALAVAISAWGLVRLFRLNAAGDGRDFLLRYVVLSVPSTIRTVVAYWVLFASAAVLVLKFTEPAVATVAWKAMSLSAPVGYVVGYLAQVGAGLARASGRSAAR